MSTRVFLAAGAMLALLTSCAPRRPEPVPLPPPPPAPAPPPQPAPPPPLSWEDAPLTAGDWTYRDDGGGRSSATFGAGGATSFVLRCESNRSVLLARTGVPGLQASTIDVRTSYGARRLPATIAHLTDALATLAASDSLLDEMAFSRGRFAVEAEGAPLLILPSWPEIARIAEDCRG